MIANLMMYRRPELNEAHAQLWRFIHARLSDLGIASPETLSQDAEEFFVWKHPDLVLSQTCGMPHGFWFENRLQTEQHLASARAVATGHADIASLDAVTWRNIEKYEPFATDLRVLEWTKPTPGLPLITALGQNAELIFQAVLGAIGDMDQHAWELLGIQRIVKIPKDAYLSVRNPD